MILVDTSVWIDHMRRPIRELDTRLRAREILCHGMVIGELACGNLRDRESTLRRLHALPVVGVLTSAEVLEQIEVRGWMGRGIGYVDANLLGSVLAHEGSSLWTRDRRLRQIAEEIGIAHTEAQAV
ncbi:MAG: PIN domain-containing protein [Gammaproteobacteria bacterium]|nr:PIN domain-containing protein [Gammaproteobacteria bacterium]MDE0452174.1 PIN domain-containing protein [Gammaproteobacteria bacterium]